jgi:hypothetical protein
MNTSLRTALSQITQSAPVQQHAALLADLHQQFQHSICPLESIEPIESYTCAVYSFHLVADPTYTLVASSGQGGTFAGKEFVEWIIQQGMLVPVTEIEAISGDLIVYFEGDDFCHVGRLARAGRVVSKWGVGLLVEHAIWEVPLSYGSRVANFRGLTPDESFHAFVKYAESQGFEACGK